MRGPAAAIWPGAIAIPAADATRPAAAGSADLARRRPALLARARITAAVRAWFAERGFTEVETPALQVSPGNEAHLHAFSTTLEGTGGGERALHLRTSPEFAAKTLLAQGERRIFEFARVWRNRERGPLHHPEFTLLEWYRAEEGYGAVVDDCLHLMRLAADVTGVDAFAFRGLACDPRVAPERLTLAQAFAQFAGFDLLATVDPSGGADRDALAVAAQSAGVRVADDDTWSDVFSRVLAALVEPRLGVGRPTVLCEYPAPEAALARRAAHDPRVAERFELYACGVELANGFGELTDAAEQRRRFQAEMAEMRRVYGRDYPLDEAFLSALPAMPEASGVALGFDRLAMLAAGVGRIEDVLWSAVASLDGVPPLRPLAREDAEIQA